MQGQFLQLVADNIDHNAQTLDSLNTFHSIGMISAVAPGNNCTSRIFPHEAMDAAIAKVDIHFYKKVEMFNIKYGKLSEIRKDDLSRNIDILWNLSWLLHH